MRTRFSIELETLPLPAAEDFRVALANEEVARIQRDIARRRPDNIVTLATISGVGDRKLDAYGDDILALLAEAG